MKPRLILSVVLSLFSATMLLNSFATALPPAATEVQSPSVPKEAAPKKTEKESSLGRYLQALIDAHDGEVAVMVKHLRTGETYRFNADKVMPTASMIKFPVMVTAYKQVAGGKLDLDTMITLHKKDKVPPSGVLTPYFSEGTKLSVHDCIRLMIAFSDNTATNLVLDQVGLKNVNETMKQLGHPQTRINAKVFRRDTSIDLKRSQKYGLGSTTPAETVALYEQLLAGKLGDANATKAMQEHLATCREDQKITRFLPSGTKVLHKGGSVAAVRCEAGVIFSPSGPIAICVMTAKNEDKSWKADNAGNLLCANIAKTAYHYFNPGGKGTADSQPFLAKGATGEMVEVLQRTLNARMKPSPELSVDGDFGSGTEGAVLRFQRENKLETSGQVTAAMWKKLAPLVTKEGPVAAPAIINAKLQPRAEPDPLDGPPFTTCKAWAIADGETGNLLWGKNQETPLDFASTTKIMTAYLVCKLAEKNPAVLQEKITFSERADNTAGSTSGIRRGESLTAGELLYGLLLPSGNDASVALAEHFGGRFADKKDPNAPLDNYGNFVAEMNRAAKRLGMKHTTYKNTHGLTAKGHKASCADLLKLAYAAMQNKTFRKCVSTREHGTTVQGASGYTRNLHWKNTNRLLKIKGYDGIKTGTTNAAGACLVSSGHREGRHLLMVVLGAVNSDARYADSKNLYRWAWKKRLKQ